MADSEDEFDGFDIENCAPPEKPSEEGKCDSAEEEEEGSEEGKCEIVNTNRNSIKLIHNGFLFYKDKKSETKTYWECVNRRDKTGTQKCYARATTIEDHGNHKIVSSSNHNHQPDPLKVATLKHRNALKRKAEEGSDPPEKIIRYCAAESAVEVQTTVSRVAQRLAIQRHRVRTSTALLPDPVDFSEIDEEYSKTYDNEPFLLKNLEVPEGRIMIFSTVTNLRRLGKAKIIILDGTFSSAPAGFRQIYTIHGQVCRKAPKKFLPYVHILLPSKSEAVYKKAIKALKHLTRSHGITLDPMVILTDFESAQINALKGAFPDAQQQGCFFHLIKNFWKRLQKLGLTKQYSKSLKIQIAFRQTEALAFLQPKHVVKALTAIRKSAPQSMTGFFDYVKKNYVQGKLKPNGRRSAARFPPELWASENATLNGTPRTSNSLEGWHNKFNRLFKGMNPLKFYTVLKAFKEEERSTSAEYLRCLQGDIVDRTNKKTEKKEKNLQKAIKTFHESDLSLFDHVQALALILQNK